MLLKVFIVGLGGFLGVSFRFLINIFISKTLTSTLPLATLLVNLVGSFFIGYIITYNITNENLKLFLVVGLLGGLTTFSTFTYENLHLLNSNNFFLLFSNIAFNVILCLFFCYIGTLINR